MSWLLAIALALAAFAAMVALFRLPRAAWTSALAALAFGLAGYALQGSPGLPGRPTSATPESSEASAVLIDLRRAVVPDRFHSRSNWLITADGLARRGRAGDAAVMLRGAIRESPRDQEAWLALGNALVASADGAMTPAAQYAYRRAEELAPESPGVPFFVGIAQLDAGRLVDARSLWEEALRRAPEGSEERAEIAMHIARLDAVLRQIVAEQGGATAPAAPGE